MERQVRKEEGPGSLGEQRNCSLIKTEEEKKKLLWKRNRREGKRRRVEYVTSVKEMAAPMLSKPADMFRVLPWDKSHFN